MIKWVLGFIASAIFITIVSFFFVDSLVVYSWEPKLNKRTFTPGTIVKCRSEGWGVTYMGRYGVTAIQDISKVSCPKVAIWGNSYVEALQVNDNEKLAQVFTEICHTNILDVLGFGVGHSGDDIAEYYFDIPSYENITENILVHYVFLGDIEEIIPITSPDNSRCSFISDPAFRLAKNDWKMQYGDVKKKLYRYNLHYVWHITRSLLKSSFRFTIGKSTSKEKINSRNQKKIVDYHSAWAFLLNRFKGQSNLPIVFVYCPTVPSIKKGAVIFSDINEETINIFAYECKKHNIGFINLKNSFIKYYQKKGRFPRGFPNTRPAEGHLNREGHRLVAEAIYDNFLGIKR